MLNLGGEKMLTVLFIAMLLFGPNELPKVMRQAGRAHAEYRRMVAGLRRELDDALNPDDASSAAPPATLGSISADSADHDAASASASTPTHLAEEPQP